MNTQTFRRSGPRLAQAIRDLSIQVKLLVLTLGMLSLLLVITIAATLDALGQFEEQVSDARLSQERALFTQRLGAEQDVLKDRALELALDPSVLAAVDDSDRTRLQRLAVTLRLRYQLDQLEIVDPSNRSLLNEQPAIAGLQESLNLALLTVEHSTVVAVPEGALLTAAVPLKDANGIRGAILVGRLIDNAFLQSVNANRMDPVLLLHGASGQTLATSGGESPDHSTEQSINLALWQQASRGEIVESSETAVDGTPRRMLYIPLTPGEQSPLVYSIALTTAEIQAFRLQTITRSIIVLGIVGLIAFGVLFYFIRHFITRPLTGLSATAEQLGAGNLDVRLVATGRDEIGRLTSSFDAMVRQLRQSFATLDQRNQHLQQEIAERKRTEEARAQLQEEVVLAQATIMEMSTPLIPIDEQTVVMPLVGTLDSQRAQQVLDTLLSGIEASQVRVAILDITGVPLVDTQVAGTLLRAAQAVRLLGAQVVLTGIRPEVAQSLVGLGVDLRELTTYGTLENAIAATLRYGYRGVNRQPQAPLTS